MIKLVKNLSGAALVAAMAALPGVAHAGTSTATGTAVLNVVNQCSVTGTTVNLGTYTAAQTWSQVGAALGSYNGISYTAGSQGQEYLNFGSITCDNGVPYTLSIKGTATGAAAGSIRITHNGKTVTFLPGIKKLAGNLVADSSVVYPGTGAQVGTGTLAGTGSGVAQSLFGNVTLNFSSTSTTALPADTLGVAGTATDTLTYTLNF